jgi:transcriptional regulator of acetoin/glycerol metabolism
MSDSEDTPQLKPLTEVRKDHIQRVIRSTGGDLDQARRILGISRNALIRLIKRFGLSFEESKAETEP